MLTTRHLTVRPQGFGFSRPTTVRALIAQTSWDTQHWQKERGLYHVTLAGSEHACDLLTKYLALASQSTSNLVLLPELAVPEIHLPLAQAWSERTGAVVVAGSHYFRSDKKSRARCPVIVAGKVHIVEKISPAPAELSPIPNHGIESGNSIHILQETPIGNIAVLICSDYLDQDLRHLVHEYDLDFLCVPSFQKQSDTYHARLGIDSDQSVNGLYSLYANNLMAGMADGRSAIFGQMDNLYTEELKSAGFTDSQPQTKLIELKDTQPYVICDFNISQRKPFAKRTVGLTRPNVSIVQAPTLSLSDDLQFEISIGNSDFRYANISHLFVPPKEYPLIVEILEQKRIVFIVGDPGLGKTYTAVHLLKHYHMKGYRPSWWVGLEGKDRQDQRQALEAFRPEPREIVYFEDPFGRTIFESRDSLRRVFGPIIDALASIDARIVVTSRREIFEQFLDETVSQAELRALSSEMSVVSPSYDTSKLVEIFRRLNERAERPLSSSDSAEVEKAISKRHISTPLAIFDLTHSIASATGKHEVLARVQRRHTEQNQLFGEEIVAAPDSTKIVLALVFLFGTAPVSLLNQAFAHSAIALGLKPNGMPTLTEELRSQKGYRIEQFGRRTPFWRFVHPLYEEALVDAASRDRSTRSTVLAVLRAVAAVEPRAALIAATRHSVRYSALALRLSNVAVQYLVDRRNVEDQILSALHLQHKCRVTKLSEYDHQADRLLQPLELVSELNTLDSHLLAPALRFLSNSPTGRSASLEIDWRAITSKLHFGSRFSQVVDTLHWMAVLNPAAVKTVLDGHPDLAAAIGALTPEDRDRLSQIPYYRGSRSIQDIVAAIPTRQGTTFKEWIGPLVNSDVGVVVDRGASDAVRRKRNLLAVGVTGVRGAFDAGDPISIVEGNGKVVAAGIAQFSSIEVELIKGQHSRNISAILGTDFDRRIAIVASGRIAILHDGHHTDATQ